MKETPTCPICLKPATGPGVHHFLLGKLCSLECLQQHWRERGFGREAKP
jgi:hypothetical protein